MGHPVTGYRNLKENNQNSGSNIHLIQRQKFLHDRFFTLFQVGMSPKENDFAFVEEDYAVG